MPMNTGTAIRELKIGPYAGGINQYSDQSAIADDEMVDCVNFDIDLDGSLKSRPPWRLLKGMKRTISGGAGPPPSDQLILGTYVYNSVRFIIFRSTYMGAPAVYVQYVGGTNDGDVVKIADGNYGASTRYADEVFINPMPVTGAEDGYKYNLNTGVVTVITDMPRGNAAVVYKDRLWISGRKGISFSSRIYFSAIGVFDSFPNTNFFDINPGDGDDVNDLAVYQDNLCIFKDSATYVLSYDSGPAQAVLQVVNTDIGVNGPYCVQQYENSIFLLQYNQVYEMVNFDFTRVSVKLPFQYDPTLPSGWNVAWKYPIWLRRIGDRLIARFYNNLYVYHLRLRAWTRWDSEDANIKYVGPISLLDNTDTGTRLGYNAYVATSSLSKQIDSQGPGVLGAWNVYSKIFVIEDRYTNTYTENGNITPAVPPVDIKLKMLTKTYDIGVSHRFKRLMHWGIDSITGRPVTGSLFPFTVAYKLTWGQLHFYQWSKLNTWAYPLFAIPSVTQTQSPGTGLGRCFLRFPMSLRFRLIQFQVEMLTTGNFSDGPARLYSLTAFVGGKQLVPKAVN